MWGLKNKHLNLNSSDFAMVFWGRWQILEQQAASVDICGYAVTLGRQYSSFGLKRTDATSLKRYINILCV